MNIYQMRKLSSFEEIDYLKINSLLKGYQVPRAKITSLLRKEELIRIKKGLYIFGAEARIEPYCKEHLANLIYGPSAISLESALSFYSMIPERVTEITSITLRRNKKFKTPVGTFSYRYIAPSKYAIGITQTNIAGRTVLIASPEKAICDILYFNNSEIRNLKEMEDHLFENLRIDPSTVKRLSPSLIQKFSQVYHHANITLFLDFINYFRGSQHASRN